MAIERASSTEVSLPNDFSTICNFGTEFALSNICLSRGAIRRFVDLCGAFALPVSEISSSRFFVCIFRSFSLPLLCRFLRLAAFFSCRWRDVGEGKKRPSKKRGKKNENENEKQKRNASREFFNGGFCEKEFFDGAKNLLTPPKSFLLFSRSENVDARSFGKCCQPIPGSGGPE